MMLLQKHKWIAGSAASALVVASGLVWWLWSWDDSAQVARVKELGQQMMESRNANATPEQRREMAGEFREAFRQLSPDQREELMKDRQKAMQQEMDRFFTLNKQEQVAFLDTRIDEMEKMRQRFEGWRNQNAGKANEASGNRGGRRSQPPTKAERELRMIRRLDSTTPEQRAKMAEFMKSMQKRREERGLPELRFPGR